jgi:hypothetical protein
MWHSIAHAHCDRAEQQVHCPIPALRLNLFNGRAVATGASIVKDNINPARFLGGKIH